MCAAVAIIVIVVVIVAIVRGSERAQLAKSSEGSRARVGWEVGGGGGSG